MSKRQVLMILGVWVMALLYLGFPDNWDKFLLLATGLIIIFIAYKSGPSTGDQNSTTDKPYVDYHGSKDPQNS